MLVGRPVVPGIQAARHGQCHSGVPSQQRVARFLAPPITARALSQRANSRCKQQLRAHALVQSSQAAAFKPQQQCGVHYRRRHGTQHPRLQALNSAVQTSPATVEHDSSAAAARRVKRLETLVELKKLYRNCLRAETLLEQPSPVYSPPAASTGAEVAAATREAEDSMSSVLGSMSEELGLDAEEQERISWATRMVAEMQLAAEQLKIGLRALPRDFGVVFEPSAASDAQISVRTVCRSFSDQLRQRATKELPLLPYSSVTQAQAACDARNARYNKRLQPDDVTGQASTSSSNGTGSSSSNASSSTGGPINRLNQAEKVAEQFVARRIKPALERAQQQKLQEVLRESSSYLRGLWVRLNGGGKEDGRGLLPTGLPLPLSTRKDVEKLITELGMELQTLEKQLQDASKAREARLRKAGPATRAGLASQLKLMDAEVVTLSRLLAVRTLQLEMAHVYKSLEEEALDVASGDLLKRGPLAREGSTIELQLLVAEYGLLEEQLSVLAAALGSAPLALVDDEMLDKLAVEVPDLRIRVGVPDADVYGSNPFSLTKLQLQAKESMGKVSEGIDFLTRGLRLLGTDVATAGRLFSKAALGGTLKPREVTALRRTAVDLLTFVPFTIILIVPMTPLGHVLVFGFIQRYFPGFFPSQFSTRRQFIMSRYEELQGQLAAAQALAEQEDEEAELARAAAAVARLTAPSSPNGASASATSAGDSDNGGSDGESASAKAGRSETAAKVKLLEEAVMEARESVRIGDEESEEEGEGEAVADSSHGAVPSPRRR